DVCFLSDHVREDFPFVKLEHQFRYQPLLGMIMDHGVLGLVRKLRAGDCWCDIERIVAVEIEATCHPAFSLFQVGVVVPGAAVRWRGLADVNDPTIVGLKLSSHLAGIGASRGLITRRGATGDYKCSH